jgi:hypothetical protein
MGPVHRYLGNLFFRGAGPSELSAMPFRELKYWNDWHEVMATEERRSAEQSRSKKGK